MRCMMVPRPDGNLTRGCLTGREHVAEMGRSPTGTEHDPVPGDEPYGFSWLPGRVESAPL